MIELKHITKRFPTAEGEFTALNDVSLTIGDGDIFGIVGMSGAGKSTLVRCLNLLERPSQGQVVIDGEDMTALSPKALRASMGALARLRLHRGDVQQAADTLRGAGIPLYAAALYNSLPLGQVQCPAGAGARRSSSRPEAKRLPEANGGVYGWLSPKIRRPSGAYDPAPPGPGTIRAPPWQQSSDGHGGDYVQGP